MMHVTRQHIAATALALAIALPVVAEGAFRFEDYEEKTAFANAVNEHFPVGSSYQQFKRTVLAAGASSSMKMEDKHSSTHVFKKTETPPLAATFISEWTISVTEDNDRITAVSPTLNISVRKDEEN